MRKIVFVFIILCSLNSSAEEDEIIPRYGIFSHFNLNYHSADFSKLPGCPSCSPGYENGSGTGLSFGALYEFPYQNKILLSVRASYFDYSATLNRIEPTTVMYNKKSFSGEFEHNLNSYLASAGIEPGVKYMLFNHFYLNLFLHTGIVIKSDYKQYEKIIKPSDAATFLDSNGIDTYKRIRNESSGAINESNGLNFTLMPGLSYELALNKEKTFLLDIEAFYSLGLTSIVNSSEVKSWSANSLKMGIALKYSPKKQDFIIKQDTAYYIDTLRIETNSVAKLEFKKGKENISSTSEENGNYLLTIWKIFRTDTIYDPTKYNLDCAINAVGVMKDGTEILNPYIRIEEFISSKLQPLLNYVFFNEASAELLDKYMLMKTEEASEFNESRLFHDSVLGVYYQLLNVVGSRMRDFPEAVLRIIGCNDGYSSEKNDVDLSQKRAKKIQNYFMNVWKIKPERLKIEARNLPENPSTPINQLEKIEENRRVELQSDEYEIIKPVFMTDTIRVFELPVIRFKPNIQAEAGLKKWRIRIRQSDEILKNWEYYDSNYFNIDWEIGKEKESNPRITYPLIYRLFAEDLKGNKDSTRENFIEIQNISISQKRQARIEDKEYEKYSLILFDFNKADISYTNSRIIDFIKSRMQNNSTVVITGHTDRTGDDDYNKKLSADRAVKTKEALGKVDANASGLGEIDLLYNNDIPEGRFYCRTVNITVETLIK